MQYREIESSPRSDRAPRRVMGTNLENGNGEVEWADEESDLDPSYDPDDLSASDDSDTSGITLGSQDTESDASDDSDESDLSGFIVDDDCIEFYSTDEDDEDDEDDESD